MSCRILPNGRPKPDPVHRSQSLERAAVALPVRSIGVLRSCYACSPSADIQPLRAENCSVRAYSVPSGDDAHEALVQFPLIVENRLTDFIHRPHALWVIGVINEAARKHLIAVPRRIEEVNRLASRDAVSGRADVERNVIASNDVCRLADLVPGVQRKRDVMEFGWLGSTDEGDVVRL